MRTGFRFRREVIIYNSFQTLAEAQASKASEASDALDHKEPDMNKPANKVVGTFVIDDNSTDLFDWPLRLGLKAPNLPPSAYWDQIPNNGGQKTEPRRCTSLVFSHMLVSESGGHGAAEMMSKSTVS